MPFPKINIDTTVQNWMKFQIRLLNHLRQYLLIKIIDINNSYLAAKFLYIFNDFICFRLTDRKLVLIHAKLSDHFHKCINCKCIMLHRYSEFFLYIFTFDIMRLNQFILFYNLSCVSQKFDSFLGNRHPSVASLK